MIWNATRGSTPYTPHKNYHWYYGEEWHGMAARTSTYVHELQVPYLQYRGPQKLSPLLNGV